MTKNIQELIDIIKSGVFTEEEKIEQIQAILSENPELVNAADKHGWTPLLIASQKGHLEIVKALLAIKGIDVNHANKHGWTPLFVAIRRDHPKIVQELLKHSVDINAVDKGGWTALYIASQEGHLEVVKALLAIKGIDVNAATDYGNTPLILAACIGHLKVVQELLKHSVDINAVDKDGWTALYIASRYGHTEAAQLIIEHMLIRNETKPDFLNEKLLNHWSKCTTEIEKMQNLNVGDSEISFFDILVADKKKLASCVNDDNIIKVLDTYDYEGNFSVYADKIKSQYTKEMNKKVAADIILNLSKNKDGDNVLVEDTSRMVFNLLDYKEIRNLCKAGYQELIEKRHTNTEGSPEQHAEDDETVSSRFSYIRIKKPDRCVIL